MAGLETEVPLGQLFAGRYIVHKLLGDGGMGKVYLVSDTLLGNEEIALKILHHDLCRDEKQTKRFLREVQLTRKVSHPNIVRTFDVGTCNGALYFTMEYAPGLTLKDKLAGGALGYQETALLLAQICRGLSAIHELGIIHRDLKPGNVIVSPQGQVKITDFGVARTSLSDVTAHNEVVGSVAYMSPEVWTGKDIGPSADIYSLGVLAYEAVTGALPFEASTAAELMFKHLELKPASPLEKAPRLPFWFVALVMRMLQKTPQQRPQSATEIADQIDQKLAAEIESGGQSENAESQKEEPAILSNKPVSQRESFPAGQVFKDLLAAANRGEAMSENAPVSSKLGIVRQRTTLKQSAAMKTKPVSSATPQIVVATGFAISIKFFCALLISYASFFGIEFGAALLSEKLQTMDSAGAFGLGNILGIGILLFSTFLKVILPVFCIAAIHYPWSELPAVGIKALRLIGFVFALGTFVQLVPYFLGHNIEQSSLDQRVFAAAYSMSKSIVELCFLFPWPSIVNSELLMGLKSFGAGLFWQLMPAMVYFLGFLLYAYFIFHLALGVGSKSGPELQDKPVFAKFILAYALVSVALLYIRPDLLLLQALPKLSAWLGFDFAFLLHPNFLTFVLCYYMLCVVALRAQGKQYEP